MVNKKMGSEQVTINMEGVTFPTYQGKNWHFSCFVFTCVATFWSLNNNNNNNNNKRTFWSHIIIIIIIIIILYKKNFLRSAI